MGRYENIIVEIGDGILWLRIDRPKSRNALSRDTLAELARACSENADHNALKAAVVIGEGIEAFAAGGDLKELSQLRAAEETSEFFDFASGALDEIRRFPVPVVAALNGWALGGGAELALACDFRVAATHAAIGYIQAKHNISCGFGGGADLMRLLGYSAALLHGLSAETLDARQAHACGLVDEIALEGESLEDCVTRFLRPVLKQKPQVIRAYKAMAVAERLGLSLRERRAIERDWFTRTWTHVDHWSAVDELTRKRQEKTT